MIKTIKSKNLKVGMFVKMPFSWLKHPFIKNEFQIKSNNQINKIKSYGISSINIDTKKSIIISEKSEEIHKEEIRIEDISLPVALKEESVPLFQPEFKEIINDKNIPPQKKAAVIYDSTIDIMNNLLENPTTENLIEFKSGISDIVDLIFTDSDMSLYLLNITSHDFYTYTHSVNVGVLSILMLKSMFRNSDMHDIHELGAGFFLHDIGKVDIDQAIINKKGRLTDEEMKEMRKHPNKGNIILTEAKQQSRESKIIVMQHHERFDGSGYPKGLLREEIHLYGRICSIADVYDALASERPYKEKLKPYFALQKMKEEMLGHFHKEIFDKFVLLFQ